MSSSGREQILTVPLCFLLSKEIDGAPVDEAAFKEGSSRMIPISREHTEDTHAAGAAGEGRAESSMADGAGAEEPTKGIHIDVPMYFLKGAIAVSVPLLVAFIACCICVWQRRQKHQCLMESAKARRAACKHSSHPGKQAVQNEAPDRRTRHHRHHRVPGRAARVQSSPKRSLPHWRESTPAQLAPPRPPRPSQPITPAISATRKCKCSQIPPPPPSLTPPASFRGW
ncbi:uncharacterized protein LOC110387177 isoform X2 [Numida meleagris]|uniref:uncharacterized protein LOC110387177 isoform X2 n=1 Tax=Numida meleagris TaxID=8996 RepID=UPI000B3D836B|nr:uncharacterized protein LOC110387177 isoform X2 [Numida meleagris]